MSPSLDGIKTRNRQSLDDFRFLSIQIHKRKLNSSQWSSAPSVAQIVMQPSADASNEDSFKIYDLNLLHYCQSLVWAHVALPTQPLNYNQPAATQPTPPVSVTSNSGLLDELEASTSPIRTPVNGGNSPTDTTDNTQSITLEVTTTLTTMGVFTAYTTATFPNDQIAKTASAISGTRAITTETEVAPQIGTLSAKSGPSRALIGGVIGATAIVIFGLIAAALCILRRRCKRQNRIILGQVTSADAPAPRLSPMQEVLEINHRPPH